MSEEMKKLAHEFGADLARAQLAKQAGRYEETVDEDSPIWSRIKQHAGTGAKWGGGLGALLGAGLAASPRPGDGGARFRAYHPGKGRGKGLGMLAHLLGGAAIGGVAGGLGGGLFGAGAGATQGSYDAGLVHALKRRENPSFDDNPTARAAATGLFLGLNPGNPMLSPVMNAAASEFGKSRGHSEPDLASALAALRGARRDEAL